MARVAASEAAVAGAGVTRSAPAGGPPTARAPPAPPLELSPRLASLLSGGFSKGQACRAGSKGGGATGARRPPGAAIVPVEFECSLTLLKLDASAREEERGLSSIGTPGADGQAPCRPGQACGRSLGERERARVLTPRGCTKKMSRDHASIFCNLSLGTHVSPPLPRSSSKGDPAALPARLGQCLSLSLQSSSTSSLPVKSTLSLSPPSPSTHSLPAPPHQPVRVPFEPLTKAGVPPVQGGGRDEQAGLAAWHDRSGRAPGGGE
jgi:hypothetical protein